MGFRGANGSAVPVIDFLSDLVVGMLPTKALVALLIATLYLIVIGAAVLFFVLR
jgi:hypothetical protein